MTSSLRAFLDQEFEFTGLELILLCLAIAYIGFVIGVIV